MKTAEEIFLHELKDYINSGISKNDLKTLINQRLKSIPAEPSDLNERIAYHKETLSDFDTVMAKYDIEGNKELRTAYFDLKQSYVVLLNSFESKLKI